MLTVKRKKEIEQVANDVISNNNITSCPAKSLYQIMQKEHILFFKNSFDDKNFDGLITINNDGQYCIYINTYIDYPPRHNFTIAHELGHYFLKHKLVDGSLVCNRDDISENNNYDNNIVEQEANYFAAVLLMPEIMFKNSYKKIMKQLDREKYGIMYVDNQSCNYRDWKRMFNFFYTDFKISILALRYRLESFNLIKFDWDTDNWTKSIEDYINISYLK